MITLDNAVPEAHANAERKDVSMKHRQRVLLALLLVASVSCTANKAAYVALGVTVHTVDVGMQIWANYVVTAHPPAEKEIQVRSAYQKYQDTAHALQLALEATNTNPTPPQLAAAADSLISLIEEISGKTVPR